MLPSILFCVGALIGVAVCNPIHPLGFTHSYETLVKRQSPVDYFSTYASSSSLVWYSCYTGLQCARLEVPLDYSKPVVGDVFKLALVKVPANTTVPYKGTYLLMDGLQSNVDFTTTIDQVTGLTVGVLYQQSNLQGYDIISWDTRGVGHTTPVIQCFANDAAESTYAVVEREGPQLGAFNGTYPPTTANIQDNIQKVSAHQKTFGPGCQTYYGHFLPYIGSADNARDLNQIIKLIGGTGLKTMYLYGYSTVLGATYASMFPNSFDRMALDGVVNTAKLYLTGDNGPSSIVDAKKGEQVYFDSCSAAGPCPSAGGEGTCCWFWASTPSGVQSRYEALKAKYYYKPFKSVPPSAVCGDCTREYYFIATALADIVGLGSLFADLVSLQLLEWETGTAFPGGAVEFFASNFPPSVTFSSYLPAVMSLDQTLAIQGSLLQQAYLVQMNSTSSQVGPEVANQELYTANWPLGQKLKNPYTGPIGGLTRGKMLFIGNSADPLTPISNARLISALFPGSGVLEINALGSSTVFNGDSPCADNYRKVFWDTGAIPPPGAYCNDIQNGIFGKPYVKDYR